MSFRLRTIIIERHINFMGNQVREYYVHGNVPLFVVHDLDPEKVNLQKVISKINQKVPKELFKGVDGIYVAHLPEFDERDINAVYKDDTLYVTNRQDSDIDMVDDIVHELAHSVEVHFHDQVYGDGDVEYEFLAKRKRLYRILKNEGYPIDLHDFLKPQYDEDFDNYLYSEVGYNALDGFIVGSFLSPYSITSLREYFATSFTDYFVYDREKVKTITPAAYAKIKNLIKKEK